MCIWLCVVGSAWGQKTHSEWAQPGSGTPGSICCHKTPVEWAQPGIGTPLVLPEVRKPCSEWAQPGIGAAGVGVCVCIWLCVVGSAWGQKIPFSMGSIGYQDPLSGSAWGQKPPFRMGSTG